MSFFNPFRKNARSERVKLSGMTQPEEGEAAPEARAEPTLGGADRREPSLSQSASQASSGLQEPAFRAPAAEEDAPPPFAFSESPAPAPAAAPAAAQNPAPWDPYGIHGAGRTPDPAAAADPLTGALPDSLSAEPAPALTVPPPPAPAPRAEPAESAPAAAPEPVMPALSAAPAAEVPPEPEAPQAAAREDAQEGLKPAMQPVPREQIQPSAGEKPRARPVRRALTEAELTARRRTRHRMVGAAVILMAAVVAAPFVLDSDPPIDTEKLESVSTDIPKESETSTALAAAPAAQGSRAEAGDVDVTDTSLGRKESTAKANLAREAKGGEQAKNAGEKPGAARAPEKKAEKPAAKPAQAAGGQAKSAGITPPTGSGWYVQILATSNEEAAERVVRKLALLGLPAYRTTEGGSLWKVRAGLFGTQKEAEGARGTVVLNGIAQKPYIRKQ